MRCSSSTGEVLSVVGAGGVATGSEDLTDKTTARTAAIDVVTLAPTTRPNMSLPGTMAAFVAPMAEGATDAVAAAVSIPLHIAARDSAVGPSSLAASNSFCVRVLVLLIAYPPR
jgi:hypothetical protein